MNKMPQSFKIRVNRSPVSAEFLPSADDRKGRLGFGWTDDATPYAPIDPRAFAPQGSRSAPASSPDTNTGPYGNGAAAITAPMAAPTAPTTASTAAIADRSAWATSQTCPTCGTTSWTARAGQSRPS